MRISGELPVTSNYSPQTIINMNQNETIEKLRKMRLGAMARMHHQHLGSQNFNEMTPDEYLSLLTDHEFEERQQNKINRLIKQARFKQQAAMSDINYAHPRNLEKAMFQRLAALEFINKRENIIITGAAGTGKSYLAQALGHQACLMGFKVCYANTARLLKKMKLAKVDGTYLKELNQLNKIQLLLLDDFGLQAFDNHDRDALLDIIDDRYNQGSVIIASQIPVSAWYEVIGESTVADAILDRIVNSSHRINLTGESLRKTVHKI
jgi:DNA replication protein DnaC